MGLFTYFEYSSHQYCYCTTEDSLTDVKWVAAGNGEVPDNAVRGGQEQGETLWVARAWYKDNLVPGRVKSADKCCYIPYGNAEHTVYNYEVSPSSN